MHIKYAHISEGIMHVCVYIEFAYLPIAQVFLKLQMPLFLLPKCWY